MIRVKVNIPVNSTDAVILIILAVLFAGGVRIVIGFFKKSQKKASADRKRNESKSAGAAKQQRVVVRIGGMMCGMCEAHIKDAIRESVPEAKHVSASAGRGEAEFTLDISNNQPAAELLTKLHEKIDPLGYDVEDLRIQIVNA